jgi:hypothetical protein
MMGIMTYASIWIVNDTNNKSLTKLKIAEINKDTLYIPQYIALANDYFINEKVDIKIKKMNSIDESIAAMMINEVDIIIANEKELLNSALAKEYNIIPFTKIATTNNINIVYCTSDIYYKMNKNIIGKINKVIDLSLKYINDNDNKKIAKKVMYYYNIKLNKLINIIKENKKNKVWNISA